MDSKNTSDLAVGVMGAGSFGTAVANLAAQNISTYLYIRNAELYQKVVETHTIRGIPLHKNVIPTNQLEELCEKSYLVFPVVPSSDMRELIRSVNQLLTPAHLVIHGTKGFDLQITEDEENGDHLQINAMSDVIREECSAVRIGCIAGPNLASELYKELPAGTVIASHFDEVIDEGQRVLGNPNFQVYGSNDLLGIELAGVLKNYIAILSGALSTLNFGENARALLISRGLSEMIYIGKALGAEPKSFLGLAGIGDLIATCNSENSRNFNVGRKLAEGKNLQTIREEMTEVAEGIKTVEVIKVLAERKKLSIPIAQSLYKVLFEEYALDKAIRILMRINPQNDADFVED